MGTRSLTRTESCLLDTLSGGQRTINELAETEALPTICARSSSIGSRCLLSIARSSSVLVPK